MNKIALCIVFTLISIIGLGQKTQKEQLDSLFTSLFEQKMFNGNVLIADKGKVIFEKSFGWANEATKQPINSSTVFELASVSKQFTAMGIVLLEKQKN